MKKFTALVIFAGCFIFYGCTAGTQVPEQKNSASLQTTASATQNIPVTEEANGFSGSISLQDTAAYADAIQAKNEALCSKITFKELQDQCVTEIKDSKIIDQAVTANDPTLCNQLQGDKVLTCKTQIAQVSQNSDSMRVATTQEMDIMTKAEKAKDKTICDQIQSEAKRENCIRNVDIILGNIKVPQ